MHLNVFLPCAWHGHSAERVHLNGCSYHVPGMGALERVFLPCARHGYSAERVHLNECSYHVPGMDTVLSGCT